MDGEIRAEKEMQAAHGIWNGKSGRKSIRSWEKKEMMEINKLYVTEGRRHVQDKGSRPEGHGADGAAHTQKK